MSSSQPRQAKAQRREAARLKTKELREASTHHEHRNMTVRRSFTGVTGLGVTGGLGYLVYHGVEAGDDTKNSEPSSKFPTPGEGLVTAKTSQNGIPRQILPDASQTCDEDPALDAVAAPAPVLGICSDYSYSHCAQFEGLHAQEINQLLSEKEVTLTLHPYKLLEQEWTSVVMNAMGVVLDEAPTQSLGFHNATFEIFSQAIQTKNQDNMTVEGLVAAATRVNVLKDVSGKFKAAVDSDKYGKWVKLNDKAFKARELEGTPTVFFKGERVNLNKFQTPTFLTELVATATPTARPNQQASQQPNPQPTQQG